MPLASFYSLQWYGPGLGAAVDVCTPTAAATVKGLGRLDGNSVTSPTAYARPNDGRQLRATHTTAPTAHARVSARGRLAAVGTIGVISQDDVIGAVLEAQVEGTLTLKQAIRLLLAVAAGDASGLEGGSPAFKSLDGSKDRITGTYSGGTRTVTTRDGS